MALPQAIERQAAEAEKLQKQVYEGQASSTEVEQPASSDQPAATTEAPANVVALQQFAEPAKAAPPQEPVEDVNYWKKRFETVQGKLNAEMPPLFQQLREQSEQIKALQAKLTEKETPSSPKPESLVTQKDIDAFGEDLIDAMRRTAREEARKAYAAEREALERKFGAVETQVGQVAQQVDKTSANAFWGDVVRLVPDWPQVDQDPTWISWLDTTPEYAAATYRELAGQAISKGNAQKIAKLVDTWKKESGRQQPAPQPAQATPARPQQSELERQVAPSTVRSGSSPSAQKILTRADYEALYDVRNVQRYGEKEAARMIAEADLAVAENRVRWT